LGSGYPAWAGEEAEAILAAAIQVDNQVDNQADNLAATAGAQRMAANRRPSGFAGKVHSRCVRPK
jgi:hypothetical protein